MATSKETRVDAPEPHYPQYQYSPVDESNKEIRFLTLYPASFSPDIRIRLHTERFDVESPREFEALSYAWGSKANPKAILIETPTGWGSLFVTQNLANALPFLRYETKTRVLWIDAICINQQDPVERSSQVKRMADVYSSATNVVIWLGLESEDSALGIQCMKEVASKVNVDWGRDTMTPTTEELHWADRHEAFRVSDAEAIAMLKIWNRNWFKRLWIWQEVWLAKEAVVLCGIHSMTWHEMRIIIYISCIKSPIFRRAETLSDEDQESLYRLAQSTLTTLANLLAATNSALRADPRDRVFSLISLLPGWERKSFPEPDYTRSPTAIFQDVVKWHITQHEVLELLTTIEMDENSLMVPSWVPNWAFPRTTSRLYSMFASGCSKVAAKFAEAGVLEVTGVFVTTIQDVIPFGAEVGYIYYGDIAQDLQRVLEEAKVAEIMIKAPHRLSSLSMILTTGDLSEAFSPPRSTLCSFLGAEEYLKSLLSDHNANSLDLLPVLTNDQYLFLDFVKTCCHGRSLLKCNDGTLALGPRAAKPGDKLVVLLGCRSAMTLRPAKDGFYQVVGEAYCEGIMDGAALLGPLPDGFRLVWRYNESIQNYHSNFVDQATGKFSAEDPRLGELPCGWRRKRHQSEEFGSWFVNDETGEDNTYFDPRLTPEALRARGVKLEQFRLI